MLLCEPGGGWEELGVDGGGFDGVRGRWCDSPPRTLSATLSSPPFILGRARRAVGASAGARVTRTRQVKGAQL
jgi:hypothetical protein